MREQAASSEDRILHAVTAVAAGVGVAALTVKAVIEVAGVSRATFYQYFASVEDCFIAAYRSHARRLVEGVAERVGREEAAEMALLRAIAGLVADEPEAFCVLAMEGLAAGPAGLAERDRLVDALADLIDASAHQRALSLPTPVFIGGVLRFAAMQLTDAFAPVNLERALDGWAQAFRGSERVRPPALPALSGPGAPIGFAQELRRSGEARERILRASAAVVRERGYRAADVAGIAAAAGVSRRLFYRYFSDKRAAFIAAWEFGLSGTLAACTPAFFASAPWPERVWESARAFTAYMASEPLIAHLGLVDCYACGPGFVRRVHESHLAFTIFLEEGYRHTSRPPPRAVSALACATITELGFHCLHTGRAAYIRALQPLAVYVALTPFLGAEAAARFLEARSPSPQAAN